MTMTTPSTFVTATSDRLLRIDRYASIVSRPESTRLRDESARSQSLKIIVCFDYLNLVVCGLFKIFDQAVNRDV